MKILKSTMDPNFDYDAFCDAFGFGPCGAYAAFRRKQGWGKIAYCWANTRGADYMQGFGHYVVIQNGKIVDLCNPLGKKLIYTEIDVLPDDEMPELVDDDMLDWMEANVGGK